MTKAVVRDFTVRDLNRRPAEVLAACDRLGKVVIRSRGGGAYELRRQATKKAAKEEVAYPDFAAWRRAVGMPRMTRVQRARLDRLIAGE